VGNAIQDGTEASIPSVTVNLYWDNNGDGDYADAGDFLYATTNSMNYAIVDGYVNVDGGEITSSDDATLSGISIIDGGLDLNGDGVVNTNDDGFFGGYTVYDGRIDVSRNGTAGMEDDGTLAVFTALAGACHDQHLRVASSRWIKGMVIFPGYGPCALLWVFNLCQYSL
jgi:hypothetical protein